MDPPNAEQHEVGRTSRTWALDGLRGLAALAVVAYHYLYRGPQLYAELGPMHAWAKIGEYGVDIFFVISGVVIFTSATRLGAGQFFTRRAIRLYPAYVFAVILTFAVVAVTGLPGREVTAAQALVNLTMFQGFLGVPYVDGAYWTLTVEIAFYLQVAVLALMIRRFRLAPGLVVAVWVALTATGVVLLSSLPHHAALVVGFVLAWSPMFGIGMGISLALAGRRVAPVAIVMVSAGALFVVSRERMLAQLVCAGIVVAVLAIPHVTRFASVNRFLGDVSYPLYLLHQNLGYVALLALAGVGLSQGVSVVLVAISAVAFAGVVHRFYEAPVRAWLTRRVARRRLSSTSTTSRSEKHEAP